MELKKCFFISPIGGEGSPTRQRADKIFKHVIAKATEECGYKAERADHMPDPGMITSQVIQRIVDDPLVIADLTERNPNVFYELAIRHAIRKPLVQIIEKGEAIPFDVAGSRTIHIDHKDLDSVEDAKAAIVTQIKFLENDPTKMDTPISMTLDWQAMTQSDDPEHRSIAGIMSELSTIKAAIENLSVRIPPPPDSSLLRAVLKQIRSHEDGLEITPRGRFEGTKVELTELEKAFREEQKDRTDFMREIGLSEEKKNDLEE